MHKSLINGNENKRIRGSDRKALSLQNDMYGYTLIIWDSLQHEQIEVERE